MANLVLGLEAKWLEKKVTVHFWKVYRLLDIFFCFFQILDMIVSKIMRNNESVTKGNDKNLEFERTKNALRQLLSVPKNKIDEIEKRRLSKPPQQSKKG
jgi:hypothetical protein